MREIVRKIKDAVDIVEIVSEQVNLRRAGARYKGLSPFTNEKTPSFFVNPETQLYYCFSTNKGGDVVDFVMETKGMSFVEALRWLADRAQITLPKGTFKGVAEDQEAREANKRLFKINRFVAHFYQQQFYGALGEPARSYAEKRSLNEKTLKNYGIGFALDDWHTLRDYLISIQAPLEDAVELGLLKPRGDEKPRADGANLYDVFRNRLIFPIRDAHGEVVGFGGRALGTDDTVKYLNSPESPIYNKGQMLYNYDRARKYIREEESVVLVEGYMDCIALDQAGIQNVVATLGTALTPAHVGILRKAAPRIVNLYDSDSAGQAASLRNMDLFLKEAGYPLATARLPEGKDPDDFLRSRGESGAQELQSILKNAPALIDVWVDQVIQDAPKTVQGRAEAGRQIATKLADLKEELWIKSRIPGIAERLFIESQYLLDAVLEAQHQKAQVSGGAHGKNEGPGASAPSRTSGKVATPLAQNSNSAIKRLSKNQKTEYKDRSGPRAGFGFEAEFLRFVLQYPERLEELRHMHAENPRLMESLLEEEWVLKIMRFLLAPITEGSGDSATKRAAALFDSTQDDFGLNQNLDRKMFLMKAIAASGSALPPPALLSEALQRLRSEGLERRKRSLRLEIRSAEARGDVGELERLQREFVALMRQPKSFLESMHD